MNDEHSKISPSGFYRVLKCPGSVGETDLAPFQPPSIYAERGTLQHEGVVRRWQGRPVSRLGLDDAEMNNVDDCIDYLKTFIGGRNCDLNMEVRGDLSILGYPDIWGTRDVDLKLPGELHVIDWKFGSGVAVEVDDNPQLLGYLLMALTVPIKFNEDKLFMHIIQPPKNYYGMVEVSNDELLSFVLELELAIETSKQPDAPLNPGEKQCKFCPAAMTCKARHNLQLSLAHDVFNFVEEKKSAIVSSAENAEIYTKLTELIAYHAELGKHGYAELMDGRKFPGYKLVSGRSTRKWKDEKNTINWLKKYSSITKFHSPGKMLSPAQMEKQARELKKDSDFKLLIDKPAGKAKMVPEDDKRDVYDPNSTAKEVFKEV